MNLYFLFPPNEFPPPKLPISPRHLFFPCQSYHCALGFHFSGALMGAVMER